MEFSKKEKLSVEQMIALYQKENSKGNFTAKVIGGGKKHMRGIFVTEYKYGVIRDEVNGHKYISTFKYEMEQTIYDGENDKWETKLTVEVFCVEGTDIKEEEKVDYGEYYHIMELI